MRYEVAIEMASKAKTLTEAAKWISLAREIFWTQQETALRLQGIQKATRKVVKKGRR